MARKYLYFTKSASLTRFSTMAKLWPDAKWRAFVITPNHVIMHVWMPRHPKTEN